MKQRPARDNRLAWRALAVVSGGISLAFAELAMAADPWPDYLTAVTTEEWSAYLLFGSIALLVCCALLKMLTYRGRREAQPVVDSYPEADTGERYTIGMYRNRMLIPGP